MLKYNVLLLLCILLIGCTEDIPDMLTKEDLLSPTIITDTDNISPSFIAFASDRDGDFEIYIMSGEGRGAFPLTNNSRDDTQPAWSPDGTKIAFVSNRDDTFGDIFVMRADGANQTNVTNTPGIDESMPFWSLDGKSIGFYSQRLDKPGYYVMNSDGTQRLINDDEWLDFYYTTLSPDGIYTAESYNSTGNYDIFVWNSITDDEVNVTNHPANDYSPSWSPDGKSIVFVSDRDRNYEIYMMNANGTNVVRLTNNPASDVNPACSPF